MRGGRIHGRARPADERARKNRRGQPVGLLGVRGKDAGRTRSCFHAGRRFPTGVLSGAPTRCVPALMQPVNLDYSAARRNDNVGGRCC